MIMLIQSLFWLLVLPLCSLALPLGLISKRQHAVGDLTKRTTSTWTFYNVETGNEVFCGGFHTNSESIVALSAANMNQGLCGKVISMTFGGVTKTATILDMCPGCGPNGLDLSEDLFAAFASPDKGVITGDWEFVDGGSSSPPAVSSPPANTSSPPAAPAPADPAPSPSPSPPAPDAPPASPTPSSSLPPPAATPDPDADLPYCDDGPTDSVP